MHTPFRLTDDDVRRLGEGEVVQRDNAATPAEVAAWSAGITAADRAFTSANVGKGRHQDSTVRGDRTAWLADLEAPFPGLRERFVEVQRELNQAAWLGLAALEVQLATYAAGAHYAPHRDAFRGDRSRRVTAILYLNADWTPADGGWLRVHTPQGHRDLAPRGGRLVVFLSDRVLHEVRPGGRVRHAATAWYRGREAGLV